MGGRARGSSIGRIVDTTTLSQSPQDTIDPTAQPFAPPPTAWRLFQHWFRIGAQSFGGGVATQFLIHKTFVRDTDWLSDDEFLSLFAMCQIVPGINLFALAILIGRKLGGGLGVAASLAGFLLPSVSITVLMTALYANFKDSPVMHAALRGMTPVVVALGLAMCWRLARPVLLASPKRRLFPLAFGIALAVLCLLMVGVLNISPFAVYIVAGVLAAGAAWWVHRQTQARAKADAA